MSNGWWEEYFRAAIGYHNDYALVLKHGPRKYYSSSKIAMDRCVSCWNAVIKAGIVDC